MIRSHKLAVTACTAALSLGAFAAPASAAPNNTVQDGLVNLALTDTTIQVPIGIAANICGVAVNVLASTNLTGPVACDAGADATAQRAGGGTNNTRQNGLVNIAVTDTTVQVPVAVAADVCGVSVSALAGPSAVLPVVCTADGVAIAG